MLYIVFVSSVLALLTAGGLALYISKKDAGNEKMQEIAHSIHTGAMAFLKREYKIIAIFVVALSIVLFFLIDNKATEVNEGLFTMIAFIYGAISSILAGFFGMQIATKANVRTANSARNSLAEALGIAFKSGAVMGLCVVGLGAMGITILFYVFNNLLSFPHDITLNLITGFGLGASSIALFARVGGGIYTKAADVGADLVGKLEA